MATTARTIGNQQRRPLVSVVVPTYNSSGAIERAIESVDRQTYDKIEIMICDDGSSDDTVERIQGLQDARIRLCRHNTNRGPGAARNTAIRASSGEYIAFLDSDDEWCPTTLEREIACLEALSDDWGAVACGYTMCFEASDRRVDLCPEVQGNVYHRFVRTFPAFPIVTPGVMVRRSALERVGLFDETLSRHQDIELWWRIFYRYKLATIAEPLVRVWRNLEKPLADRKLGSVRRLYEKYRSQFRDDFGWYGSRRIWQRWWLSVSLAFAREGRVVAAWRYGAKASLQWPLWPLPAYAKFVLWHLKALGRCGSKFTRRDAHE